MSDNSKIEWTDASWNPIRGTKGSHHCVKVSPGCANCYAETMAKRFGGQPYRTGADTLRLDETALLQPLRWKKARRIFVCSMTDLFAEDVPDAWIDRVLAVAALCRQHTFQILTKRAARMAEYFAETWQATKAYPNGETRRDKIVGQASDIGDLSRPEHWNAKGNSIAEDHWPLPNVWPGVSVEDQKRADERIPHLLRTPAAVRWLSCEPLLGGVDLHRYFGIYEHSFSDGRTELWLNKSNCNAGQIHWCVVGGESGPKARPMHPDWARSLRDQCQAAGVPFFFKQWGAWKYIGHANGAKGPFPEKDGARGIILENDHEGNGPVAMLRVGKKAAGRVLDGRTWDEMPRVESGVRA